MSTLQDLLSQAFQAHLGSPDAPFTIGGKGFATPITSLTDTQIVTLCRYGCKRAPNDKYNSENKKERDQGKAPLDPQEFFDKWLSTLGVKQPGTRIRASATDYRSAGWKAYFKEIGLKISGKAVSTSTLEQALEEYVRKAILASAADATQVHEFIDAMDDLLEEYSDQILEEAEQNTAKGFPGWFIQEAKQKQPVETPATSIKIALKPKS